MAVTLLHSKIDNELLRRLYHYWDSRRADRRFPSRADIDPIDFAFALGKIALVDVLRDPLQFRYRVWGIEYALSSGIEMTGKYLSDHPDAAHRQAMTEAFTEMLERRAPHYCGPDRRKPAPFAAIETVLFPLGNRDEQVDMIMVATQHPSELPHISRLSA